MTVGEIELTNPSASYALKLYTQDRKREEPPTPQLVNIELETREQLQARGQELVEREFRDSRCAKRKTQDSRWQRDLGPSGNLSEWVTKEDEAQKEAVRHAQSEAARATRVSIRILDEWIDPRPFAARPSGGKATLRLDANRRFLAERGEALTLQAPNASRANTIKLGTYNNPAGTVIDVSFVHQNKEYQQRRGPRRCGHW